MSTPFEEALRERVDVSTEESQMPVIQVIGTVESDISRQEAEQALASIRRGLMATDPIVSNVTQDYTVNSFAAVTASAISWEDAQNIRAAMRNEIRDAGYTVEGIAIQADIQTRSL
jgi:hypothetical protein